MNTLSKIKAVTALIIFLIPSSLFSQSSMDRMWLKLDNASSSVDFIVNLPDSGCVSIATVITGKKHSDRIWGPTYLEKGTYKIPIPKSKVIGKNGVAEFFNVEMEADFETGSRGSGERQFNNPEGIDYDFTRNEILIADTGNDRIVRLNHDGRYLSKHGGFGVAFGDSREEREDSLDNPFDVACGGYSNFYVSDQNNERICVFDSYRSYKGKFYPNDRDRRNKLNKPRGIKADSESNLWVVDGRSDRVIKVAPNGDRLLEIGGFGRGNQQLKTPNSVDISPTGEVYIADTGKNRIAVFDRLGSFLKEIKGNFKKPSGISIDTDGLLLITDKSSGTIIMLTPDGKELQRINQASDGSRFRSLSDITASEDMIYAVDSGNHRIIHIKRKKEVSAVSWQAKNTMLE